MQGGGIGLITTKPATSFAYACANMKVITPPAEVPTRKYGGGISAASRTACISVTTSPTGRGCFSGSSALDGVPGRVYAQTSARSSICSSTAKSWSSDPPLPCVRMTVGPRASVSLQCPSIVTPSSTTEKSRVAGDSDSFAGEGEASGLSADASAEGDPPPSFPPEQPANRAATIKVVRILRTTFPQSQ